MTLAEALDLLQEEFLDEFAGTGSPGGAAAVDRPDTSGVRMRGAPQNYKPRKDAGPQWPYEDDNLTMYGHSMGNKSRDRGDRPGEDVSGGPPTPKLQHTWEGADWDELQRHGDDKLRNVWKDTPDGKRWSEMNNEAMGSPTQTGPVSPMDGPQHDVLHFSSGTEEGDMLPDQMNTGPAGQWGGPGTIPGQSRGWAASPAMGDDHGVWGIPRDKKEEGHMKLREFFDPSPVPTEGIDNPGQDHFKDQSDEDLEADVDRTYGGGESNDDFAEPPEGALGGDEEDGGFTGRLEPTSIFVLPKMGQGTEFLADPTTHGAARGTYGIHTDSTDHELVSKGTAWDVLQRVIAAMSHEDHEEPGEGS